jgi:hypothetical protein
MLARYGGAFATSMALHTAIAAWLAWPFAASHARDAERPVEVVLLAPAEDSTFPGLRPVDRSVQLSNRDDFSAEHGIAGADVQRIADHVMVLFPFVTPGLALDAFFPSAASPPRLVFENPFVRRATATPAAAGRRLRMSDAALQALVDESWARGNRWKAFGAIRTVIETHDADDDRLAALVHLYRDENGLQPYGDGAVRDLRLWAQLGLAADHASFIGFIRDFASTHPSTIVTTELLFLLDTLAQANEDALAVLVETDHPGDLEWTRQTHPRAYLLAREIQRHHARALVKLGLLSRPAIERFYEQGRLAILAGILETTPNGYRANDARFLIGSILWKQERREEALRVWRTLTPTGDDTYTIAIAQVRAALAAAKPNARDISYILRNQQGRWLSFSEDRLRRFGYRVDLY